MVSSASFVFMIISGIIGFLLPVGLLLYIRIRKRAEVLPFFIGCAVMLLFAFILETIAHRLILGTGIGTKIQSNLWLYAAYGGLMAGLFEETGRFLAFKTVLRRRQGNDANALMYGAGHGGFEAIVVLGLATISNLATSAMINSGQITAVTGMLSGETKAQVEAAIETLIATPSYHFLLGAVERIFAIIMQIALSVLVWFAVKNKKRRILFPLAILLHTAVDATLVIATAKGMNLLAAEALVGLFALALALFAKVVWKRNACPAK